MRLIVRLLECELDESRPKIRNDSWTENTDNHRSVRSKGDQSLWWHNRTVDEQRTDIDGSLFPPFASHRRKNCAPFDCNLVERSNERTPSEWTLWTANLPVDSVPYTDPNWFQTSPKRKAEFQQSENDVHCATARWAGSETASKDEWKMNRCSKSAGDRKTFDWLQSESSRRAHHLESAIQSAVLTVARDRTCKCAVHWWQIWLAFSQSTKWRQNVRCDMPPEVTVFVPPSAIDRPPECWIQLYLRPLVD